MANTAPQLHWCLVRLGNDLNWWVEETSDSVHWDVDGLSIIDPRQIGHILELLEPLRDYGFEPDLFERAFIPFGIDKDLGNGQIRLTRISDSLVDSEETLFGLPDVLDEETGPYADFLDHVMKLRVKLLNDMYEFEQDLTVDEVEDELREEQNNNLIEGTAVHLYNEIIAIVDYVPAGWEVDEEDDGPATAEDDAFPDIEDTVTEDKEEEAKLKADETLRWDEDEEDEDRESEPGDEASEEDEDAKTD